MASGSTRTIVPAPLIEPLFSMSWTSIDSGVPWIVVWRDHRPVIDGSSASTGLSLQGVTIELRVSMVDSVGAERVIRCIVVNVRYGRRVVGLELCAATSRDGFARMMNLLPGGEPHDVDTGRKPVRL